MGMRPAAGQSRRSLALAGQRRWKNNFPPPLALGSRAEPSGRPGMGYRQRWKAGTALVPAVVAAQRLLKPLRLSGPAHRARRTQSPHCHLPRGAGWDPNIWPQRVSPASAGAAGVAEQLVGGKVPFLPFWLLEKGALSSFRVLLLGLFSCLSSRGCCAIGLETKGAQKKKSKLRLEGWAAIAGSGECGIWFLCLYGLTAFFFSFIMGGFFGNPGLSLDLGNALQNQTLQPLQAFPAWDHGSSADQENAQPKTKRRQMLGLA